MNGKKGKRQLMKIKLIPSGEFEMRFDFIPSAAFHSAQFIQFNKLIEIEAGMETTRRLEEGMNQTHFSLRVGFDLMPQSD